MDDKIVPVTAAVVGWLVMGQTMRDGDRRNPWTWAMVASGFGLIVYAGWLALS